MDITKIISVPGSISDQYTRLSLSCISARESGVRLPARELFFYTFFGRSHQYLQLQHIIFNYYATIISNLHKTIYAISVHIAYRTLFPNPPRKHSASAVDLTDRGMTDST